MKTPHVTAIIPTTGRPGLRRAVSSVLRQNQAVHPLVVVDDPDSFDHVSNKLEGLACSLVKTAGGVGGATARNLGAQFAETPYLAFLDEDDEWLTEKTAVQLPHASGDTVVSSRAMLVGSSSRIVPDRLHEPSSESLADYVLDQSTVKVRQRFMQTSTLLCSREAVLEVPWDEQLTRHQDWDWMIRLDAAGFSVQQLPEVLVRVTQQRASSFSKRQDWQASMEWLRTLENEVSVKPAADFMASIVARGAFESRAWASGARALTDSVRQGAHGSALMVGASGILRAVGRRG
ncbi:glycosyltransferase [Nesterenkonia salmonea]|uniref:Glycosyltransferase n=1 Tax=Nesterenkonia salmonea TaxID=1804987 RepID=A0A5R9BLC3_9MICC|nr:glycosyltransferase family 2 protein [Nesterenkonia salmonea]TLQ01516.1 glycosyltransferase [Nesterenkonia salmonea]